MNKALPPIQESPVTLQTRLKVERDAKKRQRLQALYLLASGQARFRLGLAQLLAVHRHTIGAWLTTYAADGLEALLTLHKAPGKPSRLSPPILEQLQARLAQPQGFASYREVQRCLAQAHQLPLGYSTVHKLVR